MSFAPICSMRTVIRQGIRRSVSERRAYFDRPCREHRQSIDQLAHVQEASNGMEPSRSPAIASRENRDYQRATGPVYRASFSTGGYRRLTPRFLPVSFLEQRHYHSADRSYHSRELVSVIFSYPATCMRLHQCAGAKSRFLPCRDFVSLSYSSLSLSCRLSI